MVFPRESTTDTMDITSIPPHTTLLVKTESLKCIIQYFKVFITRDMKGVLKDELNAREIGWSGLFQANIIFTSLIKSPLAIRSQQKIALVKGKIRFYILLKMEFLLRKTF